MPRRQWCKAISRECPAESQGSARFSAEPRGILDRLLLLNHERYAEEVEQGLHDKKAKKAKKRTKPKADGGTDSLLGAGDGA